MPLNRAPVLRDLRLST